jgi:acetyl-CoA carboxylase carboxyl transferase subunit beta
MMDESLLCPKCDTRYTRQDLSGSLLVCPTCGFHFLMEPYERIACVADPGSFREFPLPSRESDPLGMERYQKKFETAVRETGLSESLVAGSCTIDSRSVILAIMSFSFIGGSMGVVVGEQIAHVLREGSSRKAPVIIYTSSGGVRMQEGIFALMQMAKTANAVNRLDRAGVPLFIVLCNPSSGGVLASFGMLGDVIIAEPDAFVGFSSPHLIQKTTGKKVSDGFQRSESQLHRGFVDIVAPRKDQRALLIKLLRAHAAGAYE